MNARALRFVAPRAVEVAEEQLPEVAEGEVMVRTAFSGISGGTELLAYRGELDPRMPADEALLALSGERFAYPFAFGYSAVGTVERSRSAAVSQGATVFAFQPHRDRFVARAGDVIDVEGVDPRAATLFPLVETALQVTLDAGSRVGETVVVMGLGAVGLLISLLLERAGGRVVASEPRPWRRSAGAGLGLRAVAPADLSEAVRAETAGRGASLVVEASGNPEALPAALELLAHEGEVLVCSWYGTKVAPLPLGGAFHRRRLSIRSSQVSTIPAALAARWDVRRRREAARVLLGELPLKVLATHEFPFERAAEAFAALDRDAEGMLHVALRYR